MDFPVLYTQRLQLIEIQQVHLQDIYTLFSDEEVIRYYNLNPLENVDEAQKILDWFISRFQSHEAIRWGIVLQGQHNIIGTIGFNNYVPNHRADIGYDLQKEYWNKGYMTEALNCIIDYGFKILLINRIEAEVMKGNSASEKILEKLGFLKEGVLRQWMYWNGKHFDMIMYSLLRQEYLSATTFK